jgi:hypothetical protein
VLPDKGKEGRGVLLLSSCYEGAVYTAGPLQSLTRAGKMPAQLIILSALLHLLRLVHH